jgi:hypothetical protein
MVAGCASVITEDEFRRRPGLVRTLEVLPPVQPRDLDSPAQRRRSATLVRSRVGHRR